MYFIYLISDPHFVALCSLKSCTFYGKVEHYFTILTGLEIEYLCIDGWEVVQGYSHVWDR